MWFYRHHLALAPLRASPGQWPGLRRRKLPVSRRLCLAPAPAMGSYLREPGLGSAGGRLFQRLLRFQCWLVAVLRDAAFVGRLRLWWLWPAFFHLGRVRLRPSFLRLGVHDGAWLRRRHVALGRHPSPCGRCRARLGWRLDTSLGSRCRELGLHRG